LAEGRRTRKSSYVLVLLAVLATVASSARAERLPLQAYTTAEGLPHNEINKIVRDSRGFLWFCTGDGLSRFDGYSFTNYGTAEGLPHGRVTDFVETRNGEFWLGTNAGLVRFDPKGTPIARVVYANDASTTRPMFSVIVPDDEDRKARAINTVLEASDGTIWCGTMRRLYRLSGSEDRFKLVPIPLGDSDREINILDLLEAHNGSIWIAAFGSLCRRWTDGSAKCYDGRDGLPDNNFHDLFQDHSGQLWAATRGQGFFRFKADETHSPPVVDRRYSEKDGLGTVWVAQLFETSDDRFWVATDRGIAEFFPEAGERQLKFKTYTQRQGLLYYGINTLGEDSGGNLWLGTDVGAMKLAHQGFVSYGEQDGLMTVGAIFGNRAGEVCLRGSVFGDKNSSVFENAQSDIWHPADSFHTRYGCFDGQEFTWLKPDVLTEPQLGWVGEMTTLQTRNGEWWLGTGAGVYRFPATDDFKKLKPARPLAVYTTKDGLTDLQNFRLFEDSRGDIWASAIQPNGVAHWERATEKWHDLTMAQNMPPPEDNLARSFGEDGAGNIWIGFDTGVVRYRDGRVAFFKTDDGLPRGAIQNIHLDRAGRLWLVSSRSGLIRVDDPTAEHPVFKAYTTADGLSSNTAEGITEDLQGYIYVGTGRGLDRLDPATGHIKHFSTADGLAPGRVVAAFRDPTGELWFGTVKGLSRFVPTQETSLAVPPTILITSLGVAGEQRNLSARGETELSLPNLAANRNQLQINFVGLSFAPGEILRYQYMLEGSDADWSAPTEQRTVNYASLAPGSYKFLVRVVNSDGQVSPHPATILFTILRPFWQQWWFVTLLIVAIGAIVYWLYRYRVGRIMELANVRTRIATDLHDDIGANLTRIAILSEVANQRFGHLLGVNDDLLPSIAEIARESVSAMSDIVWAINPTKDTLEDLTRRMQQHARAVLEQRDIALDFSARDGTSTLRLDANTRRNLYLIFKEALNNIVRHAGASAVRIDLKVQDSEFIVSLTDNGAGFDTARKYDGNGLLSMKRRAADLGGRLEISSAPGEGARVELRSSI